MLLFRVRTPSLPTGPMTIHGVSFAFPAASNQLDSLDFQRILFVMSIQSIHLLIFFLICSSLVSHLLVAISHLKLLYCLGYKYSFKSKFHFVHLFGMLPCR